MRFVPLRVAPVRFTPLKSKFERSKFLRFAFGPSKILSWQTHSSGSAAGHAVRLWNPTDSQRDVEDKSTPVKSLDEPNMELKVVFVNEAPTNDTPSNEESVIWAKSKFADVSFAILNWKL